MVETKIDISELKGEGGDLIKELAEFLKEKTKAEVETTVDNIIVKGEGETVTRTFLRTLLRKFLHKQELRDYFRVIGDKERTLKVKEKKITEEE
jgi:hypothetical protein